MAALDPISRAVTGLKFARELTGIDFTFKPSIGFIARDVDKLGLEISSFKEPLTLAVEIVMVPSIRQNFEAGGRPTPWAPLAEYTVQERGGSSEPILFRTGALFETASSTDIWQISDNGAVITGLPGDVWYGALHQAGYGSFAPHMAEAHRVLPKDATSRELIQEAFAHAPTARKQAKITIPARPFILFQDEDLDAIAEVFRMWLEDKVREAGW